MIKFIIIFRPRGENRSGEVLRKQIQGSQNGLQKHIAEKLASCGIDKEEIEAAIAVPPDNKMGDYALPCFKFAKVMRKSPVAIAEELKNTFATDDAISEVEAVNGYLNFRVNRTALVKETLEKSRSRARLSARPIWATAKRSASTIRRSISQSPST